MDNLNDHDPITVIEFCAGYGGLGLGIKGVLGERMRLIGLCELEGFAQAVERRELAGRCWRSR